MDDDGYDDIRLLGLVCAYIICNTHKERDMCKCTCVCMYRCLYVGVFVYMIVRVCVCVYVGLCIRHLPSTGERYFGQFIEKRKDMGFFK